MDSINSLSFRDNKDIAFNWRAVLAEFIGTAIFIFIGTMSAVSAMPHAPKQRSETALFQIGFAHVFALIYIVHSLGPVSGAHVNPAVTFATMVTRHIGVMTGLLYIVAQLLGSIVGAAMTLLVSGRTYANLGAFTLGDPSRVWQGFACEIFLTITLVLTIFGTAVKPQHLNEETGLVPITGLIGFPIGIALGACIFAGGPITGACMNPAHAFSPYLLSGFWPSYCWIYFTAPFIGAVIGAVIYEFILTKPRRNYLRLN